jgi:hypothetical protein
MASLCALEAKMALGRRNVPAQFCVPGWYFRDSVSGLREEVRADFQSTCPQRASTAPV